MLDIFCPGNKASCFAMEYRPVVTCPVTLPMTTTSTCSPKDHKILAPRVVRLKRSTSFARAPPMRNPGRQGANTKMMRLRAPGYKIAPITNAHTPSPARAQKSTTGNVARPPTISACEIRSKASRCRNRLSETTLHAVNGKTRANIGSTSASCGTENQ